MTTPAGRPPTAARNGFGTAALVVGAFAFPLLVLLGPGLLAGVAAVVLGLLGLRRVRHGEATNRRAAVGGVALGVVAVLLFAALQAYGAYYTRGPAGQRYVDCAQATRELARDARAQAVRVCADRLADERRTSG